MNHPTVYYLPFILIILIRHPFFCLVIHLTLTFAVGIAAFFAKVAALPTKTRIVHVTIKLKIKKAN